MEITANVVVETVFTLPFGDGNTRHFLRKLFLWKNSKMSSLLVRLFSIPHLVMDMVCEYETQFSENYLYGK